MCCIFPDGLVNTSVNVALNKNGEQTVCVNSTTALIYGETYNCFDPTSNFDVKIIGRYVNVTSMDIMSLSEVEVIGYQYEGK